MIALVYEKKVAVRGWTPHTLVQGDTAAISQLTELLTVNRPCHLFIGQWPLAMPSGLCLLNAAQDLGMLISDGSMVLVLDHGALIRAMSCENL